MADARLGAQADDVLSDGSPDKRLVASATEVLTNGDTVPSRRLSAIATEVLSDAANGQPDRRMGAISVEVLVPVQLTFIGWGVPVQTPAWY